MERKIKEENNGETLSCLSWGKVSKFVIDVIEKILTIIVLYN